MADPEEGNDIPVCTLKMFPEETVHCIEWARDKFGKMFSQKPKSAIAILECGNDLSQLDSSDITGIKDGIALLKKRPKNFMDCIEFARMRFEKLFNHDVKQLLYTYPLDKVDKDGKPFWKLPKRPPVPLNFDHENLLHCTFVASMACLRATIFFIDIPSDAPRSEEFRRDCGDMATNFEPEEFTPDESKAKEIADSVDKEEKKDDTGEEEKKDGEEEKKDDADGEGP
jgi:hypothetical protein